MIDNLLIIGINSSLTTNALNSTILNAPIYSFGFPFFTLMIVFLVLGIAYITTRRLTLSFIFSSLTAFLLIPFGINPIYPLTLGFLTIMAFMYEIFFKSRENEGGGGNVSGENKGNKRNNILEGI
jgi:hypothetical protein